jgi:hypothetical protein
MPDQPDQRTPPPEQPPNGNEPVLMFWVIVLLVLGSLLSLGLVGVVVWLVYRGLRGVFG